MYHAPDTEEITKEDKLQVSLHPFKRLDGAAWIETLLKDQNHTFLRFIALVDRRSNFMIRCNVILLGLLVVFVSVVSSFSLTDTLVIFFLFLTFMLSLVYAALAARPLQSLGQVFSIHTKEGASNHFFVEHIPKDEYMNIFAKAIEEQNLLYEQMAIEIFMLSRILYFKNKRLKLSYQSFFLGLMITGGCILFLKFLSL